MAFELMLFVLLAQTIVIWMLAFRQRKPDSPKPTNATKEVQSNTDPLRLGILPDNRVVTLLNESPIDDDGFEGDGLLRPRATKTHRSHYAYYVILRSATIPCGIYQCTWDEVLALLPEKKYPCKGLKLKGAKNLDEAVGIYREHLRW